MLSALVATVFFAQLASGPVSVAPSNRTALRAVAAASPRPLECAAAGSGKQRSLWDRAFAPGLRDYCDALARGYARLGHSPAAALLAARAAERASPDHAAPRVLEGRALLAEGKPGQAFAIFERALKLSRRSIRAPEALHDLAIAALRSGHVGRALEAYRALVPRAGLLDDSMQRQRVYVEAAMLVMGQGSSGLDEAIGYLTEARRHRSPPGFGDYIPAALALALDRQGRAEEARGVAAETGGAWSLMRVIEHQESARGGDGRIALSARALAKRLATMPVLRDGELHAMAAMLAEHDDPALAREQWRAFLASSAGKGPWAVHAKQHLAVLRAARRRSR